MPARRAETDTARVGAAPSWATFPRTHPPHGEDRAHPSEALRPLQGAQHALFRVQVSAEGPWIFVCGACLALVKPGNPDYRYGGTWKSRKRH